MISPAERQLALTGACLLDLGRAIDALSRPLTLLAIAGLLAPLAMPFPLASWLILSTVAVCGLAGTYAAARTAFDAALFRALAIDANLELLDAALLQLRLLPPGKTRRPLADRVAGARRFLHWQTLLLAAQVIGLCAAGAVGVLLH